MCFYLQVFLQAKANVSLVRQTYIYARRDIHSSPNFSVVLLYSIPCENIVVTDSSGFSDTDDFNVEESTTVKNKIKKTRQWVKKRTLTFLLAF